MSKDAVPGLRGQIFHAIVMQQHAMCKLLF